jgi:hypothetical protein
MYLVPTEYTCKGSDDVHTHNVTSIIAQVGEDQCFRGNAYSREIYLVIASE